VGPLLQPDLPHTQFVFPTAPIVSSNCVDEPQDPLGVYYARLLPSMLQLRN
jgi:hypothetical protein